jgi:transposase
MSVAEQRYQAVLAVIADGRTVTEVAAQWSVSRQTIHAWLAKYEAGGLAGLGDRSRRPASCPHQMPAEIEAVVCEMHRAHPYWGTQRIAWQLAKNGMVSGPSESSVYRALLRTGLIEPSRRQRHKDSWKRWEPVEVLCDRICRESGRS